MVRSMTKRVCFMNKVIAFVTAAAALMSSPASAQQITDPAPALPAISNAQASSLENFSLANAPRRNPLLTRVNVPIDSTLSEPNYRLQAEERCTRPAGSASVRIQFSMSFGGTSSQPRAPLPALQLCAGRRALNMGGGG